MPEQPPGPRLGRYVIRDRLGAGGFARVYLAFDPDLDFEVAVKVLKPQFAEDAVAVERFRREAMTAVRLRHPNVVTVLAVGKLEDPLDGAEAGTPYLVMDYLPDSLAARLAATPILPEGDVVRIGREVAQGLAYAHQAGVVHRDVKPDNILFGRDGQAVVTDFGIARGVADGLAPATHSVVVGTPSYFSPEQARGLPVDGRTDIYALGVTLYQIATGTLPFTGPDWYAVMRQHVEDAPLPVRRRNEALSPDLERVVMRCLAKDAANRYDTAAELARALETVESGTPLAGEGSPTISLDRQALRNVTGAARAGRSRMRIGVVAATAVVAGGAAAALALNQASKDVTSLPGPASDSIIGFAPSGPDSASGDSLGTPPSGSAGQSPPVIDRATLQVTATSGAEVRLNGVRVGRGTWTSDTVLPGRYEVRAAVTAAEGCVGADTSTVITLVSGESRRIRLQPTGCGTLSLVVTPTPAQYVLTQVSGTVRRDGALPLARPIVLPEGEYRLTIAAPQCSEYSDVLRVRAGATRSPDRIRLLCGP